MELSSDLKFLADLARSLIEVPSFISRQENDEALVRCALAHLTLKSDELLAAIATMQELLECSLNESSCDSCDVDSSFGQEDWTTTGWMKEGYNALWIHAGGCSIESIRPLIFRHLVSEDPVLIEWDLTPDGWRVRV